MTPEQRTLIEKTLGVIGRLSFILAIGLVLIGVTWTAVHDRDFGALIGELLDVDEAGIIFYPLLGLGVVCLWIRVFLRAGHKRD